jgi:hypothetical protein
MGVTVLASDYDVAAVAGRLAFDLGIPLIGLICLVIGLWTRSRSRRQPRPAYPYPPGPPPTGNPGPYPRPPNPGYPPYPGYPPHVAPPSPRRAGGSSTALITIGGVVLALGIVGNLAAGASRLAKHQQHTSMQVGECITQMSYRSELFNSSPNNDCANPTNTYQLASKGGSSATCPDGKREGSIYDRYTDDSTILCFALNLKQDLCYELGPDPNHPTMNLSSCGDTVSGQIRVVQRIDGSTDRSSCPEGGKGIGYPTPAVVYCLERASPN